ncbi:outer membrane beta-barrel protein [Hymenobacter sp. YC55]|uniref:outer membrane beta-barrel protein n=1 Tax=Hymenobacter sp. YC55 TaxID=3034019 RepID=UPI0023F91F6F|nr:outer membrane beta-barrel protein [Hymenobacter sp. YC55]MDF7812837.1 outer membrane beta-barrel protein [Hymenobacter sp. YC55]
MLLFTAAIALCAPLASQPGDSVKTSSPDSVKTSAFKISGYADAYYRYNFNNPGEAPYNNLTSFTNSHKSFELGMISVKAEHTIGKVGLVADLGFGRRAEEFSYNDDNTRFAIKQLFITYSPTAKIKLTGGSWATHIGYESVDPYLNRNYSMSYMFSYGPFFHTGIKADFGLGEKTNLMVGVANPTDLKSASSMPKTFIAQLATGTPDDKIKAYFNYQGGAQHDSLRVQQGDLVLTYALSSQLSFSYNGTVQYRQFRGETGWGDYNAWWGSALYVNLDPAPWFGMTLRGEYFGDKKALIGFNGNVFETTLSSNFKIDNLTIIPELRLDNGDVESDLFINKSGSLKKTTVSALLAAVYKF